MLDTYMQLLSLQAEDNFSHIVDVRLRALTQGFVSHHVVWADCAEYPELMDFEHAPMIRMGDGVVAGWDRAAECTAWSRYMNNFSEVKRALENAPIVAGEVQLGFAEAVAEISNYGHELANNYVNLTMQHASEWRKGLAALMATLRQVWDVEHELAKQSGEERRRSVAGRPRQLKEGLWVREVGPGEGVQEDPSAGEFTWVQDGEEWKKVKSEKRPARQFSTGPDFTEEQMREGAVAYKKFRAEAGGKFRAAQDYAKRTNHEYGTEERPDSLRPMVESYKEQDTDPFGKLPAVLYFEPKDTDLLQVTRKWVGAVGDNPSHFALCHGNGTPVAAGEYGWVLLPDGKFCIFPDDIDLSIVLEIQGERVVNFGNLPEYWKGVDLTEFQDGVAYGNIGEIIARLESNFSGDLEVGLRHSSIGGGRPVLGAGMCQVRQGVRIAAMDEKENELYLWHDGQSGEDKTFSRPEIESSGSIRMRECEELFATTVALDLLDDNSGHYRTLVENLENAVRRLVQDKIVLSAAGVRLLDKRSKMDGGRKTKPTYEDVPLRAGQVKQAVEMSGAPLSPAMLMDRAQVVEQAAGRGADVNALIEAIAAVRSPATSRTDRVRAYKTCYVYAVQGRRGLKERFGKQLEKAAPVSVKFVESWVSGESAESWMDVRLVLTPDEKAKFATELAGLPAATADPAEAYVEQKMKDVLRTVREMGESVGNREEAHVTWMKCVGHTKFASAAAKALDDVTRMDDNLLRQFVEEWADEFSLLDVRTVLKKEEIDSADQAGVDIPVPSSGSLSSSGGSLYDSSGSDEDVEDKVKRQIQEEAEQDLSAGLGPARASKLN